MSGTATLITVASASVSTMPGASASTTSHGCSAGRAGRRGAAGRQGSSMRRSVQAAVRSRPALQSRACSYGTSSRPSTASRRSTSPSRGTTSACRSARPATRCTGVLVTLEVDDAALDEAARRGCDLLLVAPPAHLRPARAALRRHRGRAPGAARGARRRRRDRRAHQPRQGARRHRRRGRRACSVSRRRRRWRRPPPTRSSWSGSCRPTTPTSCARRCSPPAPA